MSKALASQVGRDVVRTHDCDFLVIGSGAAAMCAALTASVKGLKVLVVEKDEKFGGASARSGGCPWIPNSPIAKAMGYTDSREEAMRFFRHETGHRFDEDTVSAFVDIGPEMIDFVQKNSPVRFGFLGGFPDYHCDSPGGSQTGRAHYPLNWDAADLGDEIKRLRPPLQSGTFMGMQIGVSEVGYYMTAGRKLGSAFYVFKCMLQRLRDQFRAGRTLRLASGNALIGGLASAYFKLGGQLWTSSPAKQLISTGGRVTGALLDTPDGTVEIRAKRGVMVATGGFPHDSAVRAKLFPHGGRAPEVWGLYPYGNTGDGINMAQKVGGQFETDTKSPVAFAPTYRLPNVEGGLEAMPAFFNRGMPGIIAVTRNGRRFCNEGRSYHDFCVNLIAVTPEEEEPVAWLVFDHRMLRRYGLGPIHPGPMPYKHFIKNGFLKCGKTIAELAEKTGINPEGLVATVESYNKHARNGVDPEFNRGTNAFDIANGDPEHGPNPCVGPLDKVPFYAVRVFAGCVGTFPGLRTNGKGQVLTPDRSPIPGLYSGGNDMLSVTGGDYISGGCTIGPGLTFGYIIGNEVSA
ncbi:FAD-dependent oxidoreductase [Sphingobium nicotianae]|uniref:FAD-binding protein n=1 Tax=Sphingobium nicotianae TaxID=2782607 RepID=A0A9X1D9W7_9SPHN|nr:FAD-dependent oxidoreductase [Sphingobium nicotianae]MBT2186068.1 FAD-binding protein [Sphingobium nicotianae]